MIRCRIIKDAFSWEWGPYPGKNGIFTSTQQRRGEERRETGSVIGRLCDPALKQARDQKYPNKWARHLAARLPRQGVVVHGSSVAHQGPASE